MPHLDFVEASIARFVRKGFALDQIPEDGLRLRPGQRRLVTFSVHPGRPLAREALTSEQDLDIVATATADGAILGGMVYRLDPNLKMPVNDRSKRAHGEDCREKAQELLDCLDVPKARVKRVRVRKVAVDVEIDDGYCD